MRQPLRLRSEHTLEGPHSRCRFDSGVDAVGSCARAGVEQRLFLNASNVINMNVTYGPAWKDAVQILSGRLLRISAQFEF